MPRVCRSSADIVCQAPYLSNIPFSLLIPVYSKEGSWHVSSLCRLSASASKNQIGCHFGTTVESLNSSNMVILQPAMLFILISVPCMSREYNHRLSSSQLKHVHSQHKGVQAVQHNGIITFMHLLQHTGHKVSLLGVSDSPTAALPNAPLNSNEASKLLWLVSILALIPQCD